MLGLKLKKISMGNFHPLQVVGRVDAGPSSYTSYT